MKLGGPSTYFKYLFWFTATIESLHTLLQPKYLPPIPTTPTYTEVTCALVAIFGGILRVHCFRALGHLFTFQISRQNEHKLVTSGAYAYVRHPSYLAAFITFGGAMPLYFPWLMMSFPGVLGRACVALWYGGVVLMLVTLAPRVQSEDEFLEKEFQDEWRAWREDVPWRLLPWVY